jgi:NAD/NADP transhydrogenase alpha subunit
MDPVSAVSATVTLYQAGGLALVLIAIQVICGSLVVKWMMNIITSLGAELKESRTSANTTLSTVVKENTRSNDKLCGAVERNTAMIEHQTEVLRGRPCLLPPDAPNPTYSVGRGNTPLPLTGNRH